MPDPESILPIEESVQSVWLMVAAHAVVSNPDYFPTRTYDRAQQLIGGHIDMWFDMGDM